MENNITFLGEKRRKSKSKTNKNKLIPKPATNSLVENKDSLVLKLSDKPLYNFTSTLKPTLDTTTVKYTDLKYEVESWSSYISNFHPRNILIDSKRGGNLSKWSVKSKNEYLYIKLEKTSIVYIITFGKFSDPTNLKEFKIFGGLDKNNMIEILHSGLSCDPDYEPFSVKYMWNSTVFPCK